MAHFLNADGRKQKRAYFVRIFQLSFVHIVWEERQSLVSVLHF